ncbi:MAG: hypothetical protein ACK4HV_00895 [Parachlamydiaceae bacterium]
MSLEFRVLERDVTGVMVAHNCQYSDGYFRTLSSIRPERAFSPLAGTPAAAIGYEPYRARLNESASKVIVLKASVINDLWSSVSLNFPSEIEFEGMRVPEQIYRDLPRIQHLVLDGFLQYSNQPKLNPTCEARLSVLKPLAPSREALFRLATLLTQASLDHLFLQINDYFTNLNLGYSITHHPFSTIYIRSSPLSIRICRLFKLISIDNLETIGYVKGERVYKLEKEELKKGVAVQSQVYDQISPFIKALDEAIAFSWKEKPSTCLVS